MVRVGQWSESAKEGVLSGGRSPSPGERSAKQEARDLATTLDLLGRSQITPSAEDVGVVVEYGLDWVAVLASTRELLEEQIEKGDAA